MLISISTNFKDDVRPMVKNIKAQIEKNNLVSYKKVSVPSS